MTSIINLIDMSKSLKWLQDWKKNDNGINYKNERHKKKNEIAEVKANTYKGKGEAGRLKYEDNVKKKVDEINERYNQEKNTLNINSNFFSSSNNHSNDIRGMKKPTEIDLKNLPSNLTYTETNSGKTQEKGLFKMLFERRNSDIIDTRKNEDIPKEGSFRDMLQRFKKAVKVAMQ